ncbi:MAG: pyridoxamine 5'-phosphate oxidase [Salinivirgaceae bacterium]|jgi:pyridoxamine 5'-phosphate oxidase|nr:pyridoxamine 5'-phosphate oxidase [Salinivirgaceae bacterium]
MKLLNNREYTDVPLRKSDFGNSPHNELHKWLLEAESSNIEDFNAFHLATSDLEGHVTARMVLLKEVREEKLFFFTNYSSKKGKQIVENPQVAATFYWGALNRQVRIEGTIKKLSSSENDAYFDIRPRASQIASILSTQSHEIKDRNSIEEPFIKMLKEGRKVERPEDWGGYAIEPFYYEFWQGRPNRLNDRIVFELHNERWKKLRLAP